MHQFQFINKTNKTKWHLVQFINEQTLIDTDVRTDQATRQKNGDDSEDEATTDSSKSANDTSDNGVPNIAANRNSDAPHRSVDETCEEFYIKDSGSDPHRLHALNSDNEDGGDKDKETTGVRDTAIAQLAKESNCTSYEMRRFKATDSHDSQHVH